MDQRRAVLASRRRVLRQSLRRIIENECAMDVAAEVADGFSLLRAVRHRSKGDLVVVLDIPFPHVPWPEAIKKIKTDSPGTIVFVVGPAFDSEYAEMAVEAGADGYVTRENIDVEMARVIGNVRKGVKHRRVGLGELQETRQVVSAG
jgi:DNA-binding NarL/FixJ family response regulator